MTRLSTSTLYTLGGGTEQNQPQSTTSAMAPEPALNMESLEAMFNGLMRTYGAPRDEVMIVGASILNKREARKVFGLKIPRSLMIEEDCQYTEQP